MDLYYWRSEHGNVGDDLNAWLWPRVFAPEVFETPEGFETKDTAQDQRFVGIGSILAPTHLRPRPARNIIFGAGLRSAASAAALTGFDLDLRFVRGPRSSAALNGAPYISDGAILTPLHAAPRAPEPGRIAFIPYLRTPPALVDHLCKTFGLVHLPVTQPVEPFLDALRRCDYVICEAMHGAILADAFGIPWAGVRISSAVFEGQTSFFKWADWMESLEIKAPLANVLPDFTASLPRKLRLPLTPLAFGRAERVIGALLARAPWTLSARSTLDRAQDRILTEVDRLSRDLATLPPSA